MLCVSGTLGPFSYEEHTELVRAVKEEQSLAKWKAEAGLWTKTKWALFGMSDESDE